MKKAEDQKINWGLIVLRKLMLVVSVVLASVLTPRLIHATLGIGRPSALLYSLVIMAVVYVLASVLMQIPNFLERRQEPRAAQNGEGQAWR